MFFQIVDQYPHTHTVVDRHDEIGDAAEGESVFPGKGIMKVFKGRSQILCVQKEGGKNKDNHRGNIDSHVRVQQGTDTQADIDIPE